MQSKAVSGNSVPNIAKSKKMLLIEAIIAVLVLILLLTDIMHGFIAFIIYLVLLPHIVVLIINNYLMRNKRKTKKR